MAETELTATIHPTTASISPEIWNPLASKNGALNPFLKYEFFLALETSNSATPETGWHPQHIVLSLDNQPAALMPLFAKNHSQGEYVFDHTWAEAFHRAGGNYYPKLQSSIPFTPATTEKLLVPSNGLQLKSALLDTATQVCQQLNASSVHATFVTEDEEKLAESESWLTRHDMQFHWKNKAFADFDAFLATLASRKRKTIIRERKKALEDGVKIEWINGKDISEAQWDHFFQFYQNTGARKWGTPYLTRQFFSQISQDMPEDLLLMLAKQGETYIAGALNFLSNDTLYGRYWGCNRDVPFLHFELCYYQAIDYAIEHGLKTVEAGAQGGHKLARGYEPIITRSIHWIANPGLREAVQNYLTHERAAVDDDQNSLNQAAPFKNT